MTLWFLFLPALLALVILVGMHTYLGMHVLRRGIIFIDIALAQLAAVGFSVGHYLGLEHHALAQYLLAILFTWAGGFFFTWTDRLQVNQEVIIGICFSVTTALNMLLLQNLPQGNEHLKDSLNGQLLLVSYQDVLYTLILYSLVAIILMYAHRPIFAWSEQKSIDNRKSGYNLLFYLCFGIVITSSVKLAGVLVVFALLIIPASIANFWTGHWRAQLTLGWMIGWLGSLLGVALSFYLDLPTGAAIVSTLGGLFIFTLIGRRKMLAPKPLNE